jgi:hypothetical protein
MFPSTVMLVPVVRCGASLAARVDPYHDGKLVIRIPKRNEDIQIQAILVEAGVLTRLRSPILAAGIRQKEARPTGVRTGLLLFT